MKNLLLQIISPAIYRSDPRSSFMYYARTANATALALLLVSLMGMLFSFLRNDSQRALVYLLIGICFPLCMYMSHHGYAKASRIIMAFYPGLALCIVPLFTGGVVSGHRDGYFFALLIVSFIPLLLFSDTKEHLLFMCGFGYYLILIIFHDAFLSFEGEHLSVRNAFISARARELLFYGAIAGCFLIKLTLKSKIETDLIHQNNEITQQRNEIEVLLEEVKSQKEELFIQQELLSAQNGVLTRQREELFHINERLEKNNEAILSLSSNKILTSGHYEEVLKLLTSTAARTLALSRVSIWEFQQNKELICCLDLYTDGSQDHSCGIELKAEDYPHYFNAIRANKTIVADDVQNNHFTSEFREAYLTPLQITSMLDSPYFIQGELNGIICFEQQHEVRKWTSEDIVFSRAIADLIPLAHESMLRKQAQNKILLQNDLLLARQKEVEQVNQDLELMVQQRTRELELKNKLLTDYAFFNAHILRAPLCSMLGLLNLSNYDNALLADEVFLSNFKRALVDMEKVTQDISEQLRAYDDMQSNS